MNTTSIIITTAPSVIYKIEMTDGCFKMIDNPTNYPDPVRDSTGVRADGKRSCLHPHRITSANIMELCQEQARSVHVT